MFYHGMYFFSRIREEKKTDGRFYSFQSVNKICYEMLWLKHKADAGIADEVNSDTGNVFKDEQSAQQPYTSF